MKAIYALLPADLTSIKPDWSWGPLDAAKQIVGWVLAGCTLLALIGAAASLAIWAISRTGGGRHQESALKWFGVSVAAAVLLGSLTSIMVWAGNFDIGL